MSDKWDGIEKSKCNLVRCIKEDEIALIHTKLDQFHKSWFGNGDVTKGDKWRFEQMVIFVGNLRRFFWLVVPIAMTGACSAIIILVLTVIRLANGKLGL